MRVLKSAYHTPWNSCVPLSRDDREPNSQSRREREKEGECECEECPYPPPPILECRNIFGALANTAAAAAATERNRYAALFCMAGSR